MEDIQVINFKMTNNIDWDELKKKVDADLQKDINVEVQTAKDIEYGIGRGNGIINLKYPSPEEYFSTHLHPINTDIDPFNLFGKQNDSDEDEDNIEYEPEDSEEDEEYQDDEDTDEDTDEDYDDEGGLLPISNNNREEVSQEDIEKYAWNNKTEEVENKINEHDIQCIHLIDILSDYNDDVYIYPLNNDQDIHLCKQCNMNLASKIMEQLALEMFL